MEAVRAVQGIRWRSDFDKFVLSANFRRRGWVEVKEDDPDPTQWDLYWACTSTIRTIFTAGSEQRLQPGQVINHFPGHLELTRKDSMYKNIKRYQKAFRKEGGDSDAVDFVPVTFALPAEYGVFAEEFKRHPGATWIMKPPNAAQGEGIFLVNKLSQLKKWSRRHGGADDKGKEEQQEPYIVSLYIDNPLLIGGKKFDLRIYVLVTSYKPLKVYLSKLGFCRFCNVKYSAGAGELDNEFMHLTNVAVQKTGEEYNAAHGNKWTIENLRLFIEGSRGTPTADKMFADIEKVIVHSLKAVQPVINLSRQSFEMYGYDMLIDDDLRPWLIEVNASPSLSTSTYADKLMKYRVMNDTFNITTPAEWQPPAAIAQGAPCVVDGKWYCVPPMQLAPPDMVPGADTREQIGSYVLIYDEAAEAAAELERQRLAITAAEARAARAGRMRSTAIDSQLSSSSTSSTLGSSRRMSRLY